MGKRFRQVDVHRHPLQDAFGLQMASSYVGISARGQLRQVHRSHSGRREALRKPQLPRKDLRLKGTQRGLPDGYALQSRGLFNLAGQGQPEVLVTFSPLVWLTSRAPQSGSFFIT